MEYEDGELIMLKRMFELWLDDLMRISHYEVGELTYRVSCDYVTVMYKNHYPH